MSVLVATGCTGSCLYAGWLTPITGQPGNQSAGSPLPVVPASSGATPYGVATSPDGKYALVGSAGGGGYLVNLSNGGHAPLGVGAYPAGEGILPDGDWGYFADETSGDIYAVLLSNGNVTTIADPNDSLPIFGGVAACPDGNTIVALDQQAGYLEEITGVDNGPGSLTWTNDAGISLSNVPVQMVCTGGYAYFPDASSNIEAVDLATGVTMPPIPVGNDPTALGVGDGNIYVANSGSGTVSVIPIGAKSVSATITVGSDPDAVLVDGDVYVANKGSNSVSVISGRSVVQTITGVTAPTGLAIGMTPANPGLLAGEALGLFNFGDSCFGCADSSEEGDLGDLAALGDDAEIGALDLGAIGISVLGGDPVDTATGNFTYPLNGFDVPGLGPPLDFSLSYNSASIARGATVPGASVGDGWTFAPNVYLQLNYPSTNDVTVVQENGAEVPFYPQSGGTCPSGTQQLDPASGYYCATSRVDSLLSTSGSGSAETYTYYRFFPSFESFQFNYQGTLTSMSDESGNITNVTYGETPGQSGTTCPNGSGYTCTRYAAKSGRSLTLEVSSSSQLLLATDGVHTMSLAYCTSNTSTCATGDLASTVLSATGDSGTKAWTFGYDETPGVNALQTVTDPSSNTVVTNTYDDSSSDATFGWVTKQVNAVSDTWAFNYGGLDTTTDTGAVFDTDPNGNVRLDQYANGVLVSTTTGYGSTAAATTYYDRDPATLLVTEVVDPNGHTTGFTYDGEGRVTAVTDGMGDTAVITDGNSITGAGGVIDPAFYEPTQVVDGLGDTAVVNTWNTTDGQLTSSELNPDYVSGTLPTETTNYFYSSSGDGELTSVQDPQGRGILYGYDSAGDRTSVIDVPNWSQDHNSPSPSSTEPETTYGYDSVGRLTSEVAPDGNVTGCNCATSYTTSFGSLNAYDEPTTVTYPPVGTVSEEDHVAYSKDGLENSDKVETTASSTVVTQTTWGYDTQDELTSVTLANGSSVSAKTQYHYDGDGNVESVTDPSSNETTYQYTDAAYPAALTERTDPAPTTGGTQPVYTYTYDAAGNLAKSVDPKPDTVSYFYNDDNRLCIEYIGTLTNPSCGSAPSGAISYYYDGDGRRTTMKDGTGTTKWTYNTAGNVTSLQNGAGSTLTYGYNLDGQVLCLGYPVSGAVACPQSSTGTGAGNVDYGYTGTGRIKSVTDYLNNATQYGYDADGNVTSLTYPSATGSSATYGYDGADSMTSALLTVGTGDNPNGATLSDGWSYDTEEQLASDTDHVASYGYDAQSRLQTSSGAYAYSPNDQVCWSDTAPTTDTTCSSGPTGSTVTDYVYNFDSELASTTTGTTTTDYGYDLDGNRCYAGSSTGTCLAPPSGSSTYHWNGLDEMCWSATGGLVSSTCSSPPTGATSYVYDGDGLLTTTTPSSGSATDLTWDTVSDGTKPRVVLDGTNAYIYGRDMTGGGATAPIEEISLSTSTATYSYSDRTGVELLLSAAGVVDGADSYSDYGSASSANWSTASMPFGYDGNYTAGPGGFDYLLSREYDPSTGQFVSLDPAINLTDTRYSYSNDNPTGEADPAGTGPVTTIGGKIVRIIVCFAVFCEYAFGTPQGHYEPPTTDVPEPPTAIIKGPPGKDPRFRIPGDQNDNRRPPPESGRCS
jgi:RHS repeat-associated protein